MMRLDTIPNAASVTTTHHVPASIPKREPVASVPAPRESVGNHPEGVQLRVLQVYAGLKIALVGVLHRYAGEGGEGGAEEDEREREERVGVRAVAIRVASAVGVTQRDLAAMTPSRRARWRST